MYSESTEEELKLLVRAVQNTRSRFVAVQYNHYDLVRQAKKELENAYPDRKTHTFSLEKATPESFVSSIIDCKEGIVFLEKFDLLFTEELQSLAIGFNQRRDLFSNYPLQIIFFISEGNENLKQFQKILPDVFSITNPFVELRQMLEPYLTAISTTEILFANIEEAKLEVKRIEQRLSELREISNADNLKYTLNINLAEVYNYLGNYEKGISILEKVLSELLIKNDDSDKAEITAVIKGNLGLAFCRIGKYEEAKKLQEEATSYAESRYGKKHPKTTVCYSNLAMTLSNLGEVSRARELLEIATHSDEEYFGNNHPKMAIRYSNLAHVLYKLGEFDRAKRMLEEAVNIDKKNYGENHSNTSIGYSNLALMLKDINELSEAKKLLRKAVKLNESIYGKKHPVTGISYYNLAMILRDLGDMESAKSQLQEAYNNLSKSLGENHPTTITVKKNLDSFRKS